MSGAPAANDLEACLAALVRLALAPDAAPATRWREDFDAARGRLRAAADASQPDFARVDGLWSRAVKDAERDPVVRGQETINPVLPAACPVAPHDLLGSDFDLAAATAAIRSNASFG